MAKHTKKQVEASLEMSMPELWQFEFNRLDGTGDVPEPDSTPLSFGLGLTRLSRETLGVEFILDIKTMTPVTIHIAYRATFHLSDAEPDALEHELRIVAAQIAPAALYPFVRETVATTSAKAGLPTILLPIIDFRSLFNPDEVNLPALSETVDE